MIMNSSHFLPDDAFRGQNGPRNRQIESCPFLPDIAGANSRSHDSAKSSSRIPMAPGSILTLSYRRVGQTTVEKTAETAGNIHSTTTG
jgi:hypothetical protein